MPTVMRIGPYRLFFYSADGGEPPHIHVERDDRIAKLWLDRLVRDNEAALMDAWHDYFGT